MAYTEFYCDPVNGSNLNAGSTTASAAAYSATNGGWDSGTGVFTPASGDPSASVTAGDFAAVYVDGATSAAYYARVASVTSTTITLSTTAKSGTVPTTAASGISIKVGGAWKGPTGTQARPFDVIDSNLTNASAHQPRVNFLNTANYNISAGITHSKDGVVFEGYTTTPGDGGMCHIDANSAATTQPLIVTGAGNMFIGIEASNSGNTATGGSAHGITLSGARNLAWHCSAHTVNQNGWSLATGNILVECEAYDFLKGTPASGTGFSASGNNIFHIRCIAHDSAKVNASGYSSVSASGSQAWRDCIADTVHSDGFSVTNTLYTSFRGCEAYNCGGDGFDIGNASDALYVIENCNAVKNTGWGVNCSGAGGRNGAMINCGFGSGTQVNGSGASTGLKGMQEIGTVTYASGVTPWNAPTTGDFKIALAAAKNAGRGSFTQIQSGYTGLVSYPDIGAAQHNDTAAGGVVVSTNLHGSDGVLM